MSTVFCPKLWRRPARHALRKPSILIRHFKIPLTLTIPEKRREEICAVARKYHLPIIEDDAYGFIPLHGPPPLATMAPDLTWHIGGLAKCIGAGLRLAYVVAPDTKAAWPFVSTMRANTVMASPLNNALATRWIEDGTADSDTCASFGTKPLPGKAWSRRLLPAGSYKSDPISFNIWLPLGQWLDPFDFCQSYAQYRHRRGCQRCLYCGWKATRGGQGVPRRIDHPESLKTALGFMAHALEGSPEMAGSFF